MVKGHWSSWGNRGQCPLPGPRGVDAVGGAPLCWCSMWAVGHTVHWQSCLAWSVVNRAVIPAEQTDGPYCPLAKLFSPVCGKQSSNPCRTDRRALWPTVTLCGSHAQQPHFDQECVGMRQPESCTWTYLCPKSKDRSSLPEKGGQASGNKPVS